MCFRKAMKWSSCVDWKCMFRTCKWTIVQLTPENNSPTHPVSELHSGAKKTFHPDGIIKILTLIMSCKNHIQVETKSVTVAQWEMSIHLRGGRGPPFCDKTQKSCFSANAISYIFVVWWAQQHSWSVASDGNCSAPCHTWLCPHAERGTDPMVAVTVAGESEATLIHSQPPLLNCLQPNILFRIIHELITLEEKTLSAL